jgi:nucleoside-diphosphate-sugar epimerase
MKALVTGSSGFIGSHLVEALVEKGYLVNCLIRKESNLKWIKDLKVNFIEGSYFDKDSLEPALRGMDIVFHVGAAIDAPNWDLFYKVNVEGTINLLTTCQQVAPNIKKFIFVSSIAAAGPAVNKRPVRESDACEPVSLYGKSKYLAEQAVSKFFDTLPIIILRPTNVLGIRQKQFFTTLKMAKKRIIPLLGTREKQTSICFVEDVVKAMMLAAEHPSLSGETYFVAHAEFYSWREILNRITKELGLSFVLKIPYPLLMLIASVSEVIAKISKGTPLVTRKRLRSARKNYWLHDVSKIKKDLGFSTTVNFEEGIQKIVQWYRDQGLV